MALGVAFGGSEFGHARGGTEEIESDIGFRLTGGAIDDRAAERASVGSGGENEGCEKNGKDARARSTSSSAPLGSGGTNRARTAHLRFGDLLDFGEDNGGFIFERSLHELVITFGIFAGAMFELEVAKIVVNRIATFEELVELGAMRSKVGRVRLNVEDEKEDGGGESEAGAEGGPVRKNGERARESVRRKAEHRRNQSSVWRAAWAAGRDPVASLGERVRILPVTARRRWRKRRTAHLRTTNTSESQADDRVEDRHQPGDEAETFFRGLDVDDGAVFGDEGVDDLLLGFALGEMLIDFLEHALGGVAGAGEGTAGMRATASAHVAAFAHAFEVHANFLGAWRIANLSGDERSGANAKSSRKQCVED